MTRSIFRVHVSNLCVFLTGFCSHNRVVKKILQQHSMYFLVSGQIQFGTWEHMLLLQKKYFWNINKSGKKLYAHSNPAFFSKGRQKFCANLLIMEFYRKLKSYNSTDYSRGMISLKLLASVVSQTLDPFLILSKSTTVDEWLLRKTLAFLSFQIFQEVRRVRVAMLPDSESTHRS